MPSSRRPAISCSSSPTGPPSSNEGLLHSPLSSWLASVKPPGTAKRRGSGRLRSFHVVKERGMYLYGPGAPRVP